MAAGGSSKGKQPHKEAAQPSASSAAEQVPVENKSAGGAQPQAMQEGRTMESAGRARRGEMLSPWGALGGGLASVLPRMMAAPLPGSLLADAFMHPSAMLRAGGGPFGVSDRLLHELEDDMRSIAGAMFGGEREGEGAMVEAGEESEDESAMMLPPAAARLWAAVDVKETPNEFILSTDVRCDAMRPRSAHASALHRAGPRRAASHPSLMCSSAAARLRLRRRHSARCPGCARRTSR
jgi:hypothetical protein